MAIAGYAFGLFTTLSNGANVQAVGAATCGAGTCKLTLQNTGGSPATLSSISLGGKATTLNANSTTVGAGLTLRATFTYTATFTASSVTGQVVLSTGSTVPFVATVS